MAGFIASWSSCDLPVFAVMSISAARAHGEGCVPTIAVDNAACPCARAQAGANVTAKTGEAILHRPDDQRRERRALHFRRGRRDPRVGGAQPTELAGLQLVPGRQQSSIKSRWNAIRTVRDDASREQERETKRRARARTRAVGNAGCSPPAAATSNSDANAAADSNSRLASKNSDDDALALVLTLGS